MFTIPAAAFGKGKSIKLTATSLVQAQKILCGDFDEEEICEPDRLSFAILKSLQSCEKTLVHGVAGDHLTKTQLDECLQQLVGLKLMLAFKGIVEEHDLSSDDRLLELLRRIERSKDMTTGEYSFFSGISFNPLFNDEPGKWEFPEEKLIVVP